MSDLLSDVRHQHFARVSAAARAAVYDVDLLNGSKAAAWGIENVIGSEGGVASLSSEWWHARMHPDDRVAGLSRRRSALDDPACTFYQNVYRVRHTDGSWRMINDHARIVRDSNGRPVRLEGTVVDVTEHQHAQETLRQSEDALRLQKNQFTTLVEHIPDIVARLDRDLNFLYISPAVTKVSGIPSEQYIGKARKNLGLRPEDAEARELLSRKVFETGREYTMEYPIETLSGQRIFECRLVPEKRPDGSVESLMTLTRDVTERKQQEEVLRQSEARFRSMADAAPAILRVTEPDGSCSFISRGWYEYTGQTEEEALSFGWLDAINPDDLERVRHILLDAHAAREPFSIDYRLRCGGSAYRWVIDAARPRFDAQGKFFGHIGSVIDIHDRKQVEQALDKARQQAESASAAKDRFLAVLSHELRTPLTPVMMSIVAMDMDPDLPPAVRENIAMIRRNVELETKLIDDLLDLSRVITGKLRLQMESVDINEAVRQVCQTCRPTILEKGIHLHTNLPADALHVRADVSRLQQVLWNLIKNAAKFTPERGDIHVSVRTPDLEHVQIEVRDTGIGIAADVLPRIFDAFEQGDPNITRQFGGMGLGLTISRALVEMHGGTIQVRSEGPNRGATFTVGLPAVPATNDVGDAPIDRKDRRANGALRVLVVEDHSDTAEVLRKLLAASGHRVKTATSAAAALALAEKEPFDVMLSDIGLPDATGYELMQQIKARYQMKGIAMSGYGMEDDLRRSREAGFSDHVVKPANVAQLDRVIRRVAGEGSTNPVT